MATCVNGCKEIKIVGRDRCTRCYQRWRKDNAPECSEDQCTKAAQALGKCPQHYQQQRKPKNPDEFELPMGEWSPVTDYEGLYVVFDAGQVHSLPRNTTRGRLLQQRHDPGGYLQVTLSKDGRHDTYRVHVLVLTAFRGACPPGKEGAHDDGDKENCALENLLWKTRLENAQDVIRHGHHHQVNKTQCRWGHEFTAKNTRWDGKGHRVCKTCDNTRHCNTIDCKLSTHDHKGTPWQPPIPY